MNMNKKKVELLAPAGNYESFLGAIHAGADAVYLGGNKFGARAYADNFTEEELIKAIRYAHVHGRKVYLTLNTLIKTREFHEVYGYVLPFYEAGLDGVIIQDMGVFRMLGEWFPGMERHISTQMTVTGAYGAAYLKSLGAVRIVPARELSLDEIREIKKETDIEIETFIHGAICYCYSGQCLFSSIIGGRSGNRGRCAQPCRLPYRVGETNETGKKEQYPLSLKDMCTIDCLPELIEAGIDSFKIEGRMKSPEYAAGVTAVYRKYIDRYYADPKAEYRVEEADRKRLSALYIRSEISEGYYHRHNGKEMITLNAPGYAGRDEALSAHIRKQYLESDYRIPVTGSVFFRKGKQAEYTLTDGENSVTVQGDIVQEALKQPLTEETIAKQLKKDGNSCFVTAELALDTEPDIFMPVKALNDLRRKACEALEEKRIVNSGLPYGRTASGETVATMQTAEEKEKKTGKAADCQKIQKNGQLHILVNTEEQCIQALALAGRLVSSMDRIYVSSDLCGNTEWLKKGLEKQRQVVSANGKMPELYLALPYVIRKRDRVYLEQIEALLKEDIFAGVLVRNLEEIQWLKQLNGKQISPKAVLAENLYLWNEEACRAWSVESKEHYLPLELNLHEIKELAEKAEDEKFASVIYGRIPMMISANCVAATSGKCTKQPGFYSLKDRYQKVFPVYANCNHCYNVIYNSLPLSLHQNLEHLKAAGIHTFRLDFTTENGNDVSRVVHFFEERMSGSDDMPPYKEYTKGHIKRGVE